MRKRGGSIIEGTVMEEQERTPSAHPGVQQGTEPVSAVGNASLAGELRHRRQG